MSDTLPLAAVGRIADRLETPPQIWREAALEGELTAERHAALRREAMTLNAVRVTQSDAAVLAGGAPRVLAWNLERCKHVEATADVLRRENADICLLTEMDYGMARSGNRDTTADVAKLLGMGHVFATEFIELGKGDLREQVEFRGVPNIVGLHGNAVLSRYPIGEALALPLDNDGYWYWSETCGDQRRIGGRIAVAARLMTPKPMWAVSVHYESRLGPKERAEETRVMLRHLEGLAGSDPVLIGGDFNTAALQGRTGAALLTRPEDAEPMFSLLRDAGYDWRSCNTDDPTTRNHPWTPDEHRPLKKIDWLFSRGLTCVGPAVIPAVDREGQTISDHEAIAVTVAPGNTTLP